VKAVCDVDLARKLCARIAFEDDSEKVTDMLKLLVAIVHEDYEEVWMRMTMLESKYALTFSKIMPDWDVE
jgi:hypothetical protein